MNQPNPFEPPKAELITEGSLDEAELASRGQRLGAAIIDAVIGFCYGVPIMYALGTWNYVRRGLGAPISLLLVSGLLGFVFFILVHGYFLKRNGQTVGKKLVGIRIADLDNGVPRFEKILGMRYLPISIVALIPVVGNLLTVVDVLFVFRTDRRCVHDLIAGTQVLRCQADQSPAR
jgi:uncharacterized RDD family membrane protein YckC